MGLLDSMKEQDGQHQSTETLTKLTSMVLAAEQQLVALTQGVNELSKFVQTSDEETSKRIGMLEESITQLNDDMCDALKKSESLDTRLSDFETTLKTFSDVLDAGELSKAVTSVKTATNELRAATRWSSDQVKEHAKQTEQARRTSVEAVRQVGKEALKAVKDVGNAGADAVGDRLDAASKRAERMTDTAERLQGALGWAAAGRLALALLPVATVLLMGTMAVWTVVHGYQWVTAMDVELWLRLTTGAALTGLIIGSGYGLWKLARWVYKALER